MPLSERFTSKPGKQDTSHEPSAAGAAIDPSFFTTVLDMLHEAVCFVSVDRRIIFWNRVAEEITGYRSQEVKGRFCHDHLLGHYDQDGNVLCHANCPLTETLLQAQAVEKNAYLRHRNGYMVSVRLQTQVVRDELGTIVGAAEIFHLDGSEAPQGDSSAVQYDEMADEGRALPEPLLEFIHDTHARGGKVGLLILQLDNYDGFINQFGQLAGGKMLNLLEKTLSAGFGGRGSIHHVQVDRFVLALPVADKDNLGRMTKRIQSMVAGTSLAWWGRRVSLTTSIGADLMTGDEKPGAVVQSILARLKGAITSGGNQVLC